MLTYKIKKMECLCFNGVGLRVSESIICLFKFLCGFDVYFLHTNQVLPYFVFRILWWNLVTEISAKIPSVYYINIVKAS
jgi:hypothetical protein